MGQKIRIAFLCIIFSIFSQSFSPIDDYLDWENLFRFEIYTGGRLLGYNSVKLTEEGILCRNSYDNYQVRFFHIKKLDSASFWRLQNFINHNKEFFLNDTIIDDPYKIIDGLKFPKILIRKGARNFNTIEFIDNSDNCNSEIDSLILLTNNLIPKKYREQYSLHSSLKCK